MKHNRIFTFIKKIWDGFFDNRIATVAGSLTASTLLALVPLLMVVFSIFTAFPIFKEKANDLKSFIISNLTPNSSEAISQYIDTFLENTGKMSGIGIIGLVLVALMLMYSIDNALNQIWKNTKPRNIFASFTIYWTILTLGPLLVALAIGVTASIMAIDAIQNNYLLYIFTSIMPFCFTWFIFSLIYTIVPNTNVSIKHAAIGAFIATIFFTIGKSIFAWYFIAFPSYQVIYGALAILPILIVWIDISWNVILIGALVTSVLKDMELENNNLNKIDSL